MAYLQTSDLHHTILKFLKLLLKQSDFCYFAPLPLCDTLTPIKSCTVNFAHNFTKYHIDALSKSGLLWKKDQTWFTNLLGQGLLIFCKRYSSPITGLDRLRGFQEVKVPRFRNNGTGWWLVVSLTHRPPSLPRNTPGTHFC